MLVWQAGGWPCTQLVLRDLWQDLWQVDTSPQESGWRITCKKRCWRQTCTHTPLPSLTRPS